MAGSIIKIKRSAGSAKPSTLKLGELAVTYGPGDYTNFGNRLFVGAGGVDINGDAVSIDVIGGKFFTDRLDHQEGVLTPNSALVVDANSKIDIFNVDTLRLDGNTISATGTGEGANINLTAGASGVINLNSPVNLQGTELNVTGTVGIANTAVIADLVVSDLTDNRIVLAGANGAIEDSANLTFDGTTLTLIGALNVTGDYTISGNIAPSADETYSLGAADKRYTEIHGSSIFVDKVKLDSTANTTLAIAGSLGEAILVTTDSIDVATTADIGDLRFTLGAIETTGTDQDLFLNPNGVGKVNVAGHIVTGALDPVSATDLVTLQYLETRTLRISADQDAIGNTDPNATDDTVVLLSDTLYFIGETGITTKISDNTITFDLDDTTVTPGSYGSTTQIPTFTVDQQGRLTAAGTVDVATVLKIKADEDALGNTAATDDVNLLTDTFAIVGGVGVDTVLDNNQVTVNIGQPVYTTSNVRFNDVNVDGTLFSNDITASTVTIYGDLVVQGNTTTVNTEEINLADNVIILNSNLDANTAPSQDSGFQINRGSANSVRFFWDEANDWWSTGPDPVDPTQYARLEATIDGGTF